MTLRDDAAKSPAHQVLRLSSRALLVTIERAIRDSGGGNVEMYPDQLERCGSRKTYQASLAELNALGLIRVVRLEKRYLISISDYWRQVGSVREAAVLAGVARSKPMPHASQPASTNARA